MVAAGMDDSAGADFVCTDGALLMRQLSLPIAIDCWIIVVLTTATDGLRSFSGIPAKA
jgi:hypothetical protein